MKGFGQPIMGEIILTMVTALLQILLGMFIWQDKQKVIQEFHSKDFKITGELVMTLSLLRKFAESGANLTFVDDS